MEKLNIKQKEDKYCYHIARGIIKEIRKYLPKYTKAERILIISDDNVYKLYGESLKFSLSKWECHSIVLKNGENAKSINNIVEILEYLANNSFLRMDCIISLGGGVIGDIAGLVATLYMRGMDLIHIPTSLIAMTDSSVGGKTAINMKRIKNLIGTVYPPKAVFADVELLKSLSDFSWNDGMGEILKMALLFDKEMVDILLSAPKRKDLQYKHIQELILKCVMYKAEIVEKDPDDKGIRHLLNFGHTIAHAIESQAEYKISHGRAVAYGMEWISNFAQKSGYSNIGTYDIVHNCNLALGLIDFEKEEFNKDMLLAIKNDKKRSPNNKIKIVVLEDIAKPKIIELPLNELK